MPIRYLKESLCDRIAASKIYAKKMYRSDFPLQYFLKQETSRKMEKTSAAVLQQWLEWVASDGEKEAFKKIKKIKSYQQMDGMI